MDLSPDIYQYVNAGAALCLPAQTAQSLIHHQTGCAGSAVFLCFCQCFVSKKGALFDFEVVHI